MLRLIGERVVESLFPSRCVACREWCGSGEVFCGVCGDALVAVEEPVCVRCGLPLPRGHASGRRCLGCLALKPPYDSLRAPWLYGGPLRDALLALKHGDRPQVGAGLGRLLGAFVAGEAEPSWEVVVPVPLHRRRSGERGYNQAALLAVRVARRLGLPLVEGGLLRVRDTGSQRGRSRGARADALRGAFEVARPGRLSGRRVLLVDDVVTTGATAAACARALFRGGATAVHVRCLARVEL
jgi:ComF family protein